MRPRYRARRNLIVGRGLMTPPPTGFPSRPETERLTHPTDSPATKHAESSASPGWSITHRPTAFAGSSVTAAPGPGELAGTRQVSQYTHDVRRRRHSMASIQPGT